MTDEQFMNDILAKMPRPEDENHLGPYQIQKRLSVKDIQDQSVGYGIEDLVRNLERVHRDMYGDKDKKEDDEKSVKKDTEEADNQAYPAYSK